MLGLICTVTKGQVTKDCEPAFCEYKFDSTLNLAYYLSAEVMPIYKGGKDSLLNVIDRYLYWPNAECEVTGKVFLSFIIDSSGKMISKKILRSLSNSETCNFDKIAIDALGHAVDWVPGQCEGKNVAVQVVLPIKFNLK